jgi:hypothetical protein
MRFLYFRPAVNLPPFREGPHIAVVVIGRLTQKHQSFDSSTSHRRQSSCCSSLLGAE